MKEKHITRRSPGDRRAGSSDWTRVDRMTDDEIEANAASDPDNPQWSQEQLQAARLVMPDERPKVPVSIRLDREVIDYFKAEGPGYQSRLNAVLKSYVRSMKEKKTGR